MSVLINPIEDEINPDDPLSISNLGLTPLPEEVYPRKVPKNRELGNGYYVAMALVLLVWMITPLSW